MIRFTIIIFWFTLFNSAFAQIYVVTSIEPISYLVEEIGGNRVHAKTLIKSGKNPHTFTPTPRQIKTIHKSSFYFTVGVPFELELTNKIKQNRKIKIIELDKGIKKRMMKGYHQHKDYPKRQTLQLDPHIWLSSNAIKKMTKIITSTLSKFDPVNGVEYQRNRLSFLRKLEESQSIIKKYLAPLKDKKIYVFHPSFGYFLDEYGLKQEAIELEGKSPTGKHIAHIIEDARKEKVKVIFIQPQFSKKAADTIAKGIKGKVKSIDSLKKDILVNLEGMAKVIYEAYK